MSAKVRVFTLEDGSEWNVYDVMKELGCSKNTAYSRLVSSKNPKKVLRPIEEHKSMGGCRVYTLDDGTEWTSKTLAKHLGISQSTASTRLSLHTDPKKVLMTPKDIVSNKKPSELIKKRMYFDPLGHWRLLNRNI